MVPHHVCMVPPHGKCLLVLYYSYGIPHTLYGIGVIWSPSCMYGFLYMLSVFMSFMTLMVSPYLIWNRYLMVLLLPYMEQVLYGSPHM